MSNSLEILDPFDIYKRGQAPRCDQPQMLNPACDAIYQQYKKQSCVMHGANNIRSSLYIYIFDLNLLIASEDTGSSLIWCLFDLGSNLAN